MSYKNGHQTDRPYNQVFCFEELIEECLITVPITMNNLVHAIKITGSFVRFKQTLLYFRYQHVIRLERRVIVYGLPQFMLCFTDFYLDAPIMFNETEITPIIFNKFTTLAIRKPFHKISPQIPDFELPWLVLFQGIFLMALPAFFQ